MGMRWGERTIKFSNTYLDGGPVVVEPESMESQSKFTNSLSVKSDTLGYPSSFCSYLIRGNLINTATKHSGKRSHRRVKNY
jgi:hypothetical protein